jgi:putative RNA 2'-phosphotransferase
VIELPEISRFASHALRHKPEQYGLTLDAEGWASVHELLSAMHERGGEWASVDENTLALMIATSAKQRHEMRDGRIRALYGHSTPGKIEHLEAVAPPMLFHGTSPEAWAAIESDGLRPMSRQYVHLSADIPTAIAVGSRKARTPVVLVVDVPAARDAGSTFWLGNDTIWLADFVAASFIRLADTRESD